MFKNNLIQIKNLMQITRRINEDIERTDNICKRLKTIKEELAAGTLSNRTAFEQHRELGLMLQ